MSYATLGQLHERLLVVDDLLFKISTGQVSASSEEQERLAAEADWIMDALAKGISEGGGNDYQTAWNGRERVRRLNHIAATAARYSELYPEPNPVTDGIVAKAYADGATDEDRATLARMYSVIFVERAPAPPPIKAGKGFLGRLFSRRVKSIEQRRQDVIDKGAAAGKTISTDAALKHVLELQTKYDGPAREEIDRIINQFREENGTQIPVDQAYAMLKELESRLGPIR